MTYKSSNELKGKTLKCGDIIVFKVNNKTLRYTASIRFLSFLNGCNNAIFEELNIDKNTIATICYGYPPKIFSDKWFPESKDNDYEALTAIALALLRLCEITNMKQEKIKSEAEKRNEIENNGDNLITIKVSKDILKAMYNSENDILKNLAVKENPELKTPKLFKFLRDSNITKEQWDVSSTYERITYMANYYNKESMWYHKPNVIGYAIYRSFESTWAYCKAYKPYIGTVMFKNECDAKFATEVFNECDVF